MAMWRTMSGQNNKGRRVSWDTVKRIATFARPHRRALIAFVLVSVVLAVLAVHLAVLAWQDLRRSPVRDGRSGATPAGGGPAESGPGGDQGPPVLLPGDGPAEIAALLRRFPGNEFRAVDDDGRPLRTLTRAELLRRLANDHPGGPAR